MSRLVLPDLSRLLPPAEPEPLPTARRAVGVLLGRRQFLKAFGVTGIVLALPFTRVEQAWALRRGRFFTGHERHTLGVLADTMIPPDDAPGALRLGAVDYIEQMLTAFDRTPAKLFAGGPFSGRNPYINYDTGQPSRKRPANDFKQFIQPSRLQELYWRWELYGSSGLSSGDQAVIAPLDAQQGGPRTGLRDIYRRGLAALDTLSLTREGRRFTSLDAAGRVRVRNAARTSFPVDPRRGKNFINLVLTHTLEGCFAAPEYGGNRKTRGWKMANYDGDSQPLGYALYSRAIDDYVERPDRPLSTPNPDEIASPPVLSPESLAIQNVIIATTGGPGSGC